jgi:site-specific DNA-adenine methylase
MTLSFIGSLSWGANVIDKIICETRIGSDKNSILIALLKKARDNFDEIPKTMTKEEFCHARDIY